MKYVIANLKMNFVSAKECDDYLVALGKAYGSKKGDATLIVCPSTLFAERFAHKLPTGVLLGGQDAFWESRGSFTGETSPQALKNIGAGAVICGHSERRAHLGETDDMVSKKVEAAALAGLKAIVCVGETTEERSANDTATVIIDQIMSALSRVSPDHLENIVIAYEPRWAIGAGVTPTTEEIMQVRIMIRKALSKKYGAETAENVAILYGGSVKAAVMDEVCNDADMDGVLVGRESLDPDELMKIYGVLT